jgi:hypothetical protein
MPDFRACTHWSGGLREARMLTKTVRNRRRQTMETRPPEFTRPATWGTRRPRNVQVIAAGSSGKFRLAVRRDHDRKASSCRTNSPFSDCSSGNWAFATSLIGRQATAFRLEAKHEGRSKPRTPCRQQFRVERGIRISPQPKAQYPGKLARRLK